MVHCVLFIVNGINIVLTNIKIFITLTIKTIDLVFFFFVAILLHTETFSLSLLKKLKNKRVFTLNSWNWVAMKMFLPHDAC
jgi:hypothetical protein